MKKVRNTGTYMSQSFSETITKEEINNMPLIKFEGKVHIITKESEVEEVVPILLKEAILGFDTETRPNYKKGQKNPVALLQFSTDKDAYLIRLNHVKFSQPLIDLCSSPTTLKIGLALRDDIKDLTRLKPFVHRGFVDLSEIATDLKIKNTGLRSLAGIFLKSRISKQAKLSNWENKELTAAQISYAATDAWVSRKIFTYLVENKIIW